MGCWPETLGGWFWDENTTARVGKVDGFGMTSSDPCLAKVDRFGIS